jgi:hypothetical protein
MNACPHCGAEVGADDEECWNCGGNLVVGQSGAGGANGRSEHQRGRGSESNGPPRRQENSHADSTGEGDHERIRRHSQPAHEQPTETRNQQRREPASDHKQPQRAGGGQTPGQRRGGDPQRTGRGQEREETPYPPNQPGHSDRPREQSSDSTGPLSRRQLLAGGGALAAAAAGGWFVFLRGAGTGPGESFESATMLRAGEYGPYEISDGERHYFGVALREGEQLSVELSFTHVDGDLDLAVHGPDAPDADGGDELTSATSTTDGEQIRVTAQETGTYYVVPYGYRDNGNEYDLTVDVTEAGTQTSPSTPGESVADAPLTPAGTHGPYQIAAGEEQYFGVDLQEGDRLDVRISFNHADADLDLSVQGPRGTELASSTSTSNNESVTVTADRDGTYLVQVYPYSEGTASYDLEIRINS